MDEANEENGLFARVYGLSAGHAALRAVLDAYRRGALIPGHGAFYRWLGAAPDVWLVQAHEMLEVAERGEETDDRADDPNAVDIGGAGLLLTTVLAELEGVEDDPLRDVARLQRWMRKLMLLISIEMAQRAELGRWQIQGPVFEEGGTITLVESRVGADLLSVPAAVRDWTNRVRERDLS